MQALAIKALSSTAIMLTVVTPPAIAAVPFPELIGSRSTPASGGIEAADNWTSANGGLKVSWVISQTGNEWSYTYTFSDADGTTPTTPAVSHWILEINTNVTSANVGSFIFDANFPAVGPELWTADPLSPGNTTTGGNMGNPNLPEDLYGLKLDTSQTTYTFKSPLGPGWGDLYTKDGKQSGIVATAWNTGIGTDPTQTTLVFTDWIPVPAELITVPEPGAISLGVTAVAVLLSSRRSLRPRHPQ